MIIKTIFFFILNLTTLFSYSAEKNEFANKEIYLLDSVSTQHLTPADLALLDSALNLYHSASEDTIRVEALSIICGTMVDVLWCRYQEYQLKLIERYLSRATSEKKKNVLRRYYGHGLHNKSLILHSQGNVNEALATEQKSLQIAIELKDSTLLGDCYNTLGSYFQNLGNIEASLEYYDHSLQIQRRINNLNGIASVLNNIGGVIANQDNPANSLPYLLECLQLHLQTGHKKSISHSLLNVGTIYFKIQEYDSSLNFYNRALMLSQEIGNQNVTGNILMNIGNLYAYRGQHEKALDQYLHALAIQKDFGDFGAQSVSYVSIGNCYFNMEQPTLAIRYTDSALYLAEMLKAPSLIAHSTEVLFRAYKKSGLHKKALETLELHVTMKDSIVNASTQKATIRQATKYEFEKAEILRKQTEAEESRRAEEIKSRSNNIQYSAIFLGFLGLFGLIISFGFIKVPIRFAEGIIFFAFLLFFEFLLVISDPFIDQYTGGAPLYKLLLNALLGASIFPLHSVMERLLKKRLLRREKG